MAAAADRSAALRRALRRHSLALPLATCSSNAQDSGKTIQSDPAEPGSSACCCSARTPRANASSRQRMDDLLLAGLLQHLLNLRIELGVGLRPDQTHALELVVFDVSDHERWRSLHSGDTALGNILIDLRLELVGLETGLELGHVELDVGR